MDEAMDTSSDSTGAPSTPPPIDLPEDTQQNAMDVSPVLERRFVRTPRNTISTTGWMSTRNVRLPAPTPSNLPLTSLPPAPENQLTSSSASEGANSRAVDNDVPPQMQVSPPEVITLDGAQRRLGATDVITILRPEVLDITSTSNEPTDVVPVLRPSVVDITSTDSDDDLDDDVFATHQVSGGFIPEAGMGANDSAHVRPSSSLDDDVFATHQVSGGFIPEAGMGANDSAHVQPSSSHTANELGQDQNTHPASSSNERASHPQESNRDPNSDGAPTHTVQSEGSSTPPPQDVENLPLAQRIRSPESPSPKSPPPPKKLKQEAEPKAEDSDGEEEGKLCPICFDVWTNSGDHRLVALRCGHLFGLQCIQHWLQIHKANDRRCPQCKKKASIRDIRHLYASKIRVLDTSEQEQLKETVKRLELEKEQLTRELAYERQLNQEAMRVQREQQMKLQQLQNQGLLLQHQQDSNRKASTAAIAQLRINMIHRVDVSSGRVLAFNEWKGVLVASQSVINPLFPDFGIRMIDTAEFRLRQFMPMHAKAIRDLSFNQLRKDLLLSVSLDRTAKVFCMSSNTSVLTFNAENPLWSCCWDGDNPNVLYTGSQNGVVLQYDIRNSQKEVSRISIEGEFTPVVSLASVPSCSWLPRGGFLSCRMNRLRVYERNNTAEFSMYPMEMEGTFTALNYDHRTQHMLLSTRPTTQAPHAQHQLYQMTAGGSQPKSNLIHSFLGGTRQRVISRPCQLHVGANINDTFVCAHEENEGHNVSIWSVSSGQKLKAWPLPSPEPIMDLCPFNVNNRAFLASVSEKSLRVYQFS